jgi:hypothetical protein
MDEGKRDWFKDTGVDKNEVMKEREQLSGITSEEIDKRVGVDKIHTETGFQEGSNLEGLPKKKDFQDGLKTGYSPMDEGKRDWFKDTGVDKNEVMKEREQLSGITSEEIDKQVGIDKIHMEKGFQAGGFHEGSNLEGHRDWFKDTGVDKQEVMEERRAVLGEHSDLGERRAVLGERTENSERFDNTSNTLANKAGQLKETVAIKAGQMKDSALEKGGQLKDAALEKGGQLKDAALEKGSQIKAVAFEKGGQMKDVALEKGGQWKDAAADKAFQLKDSAKTTALETGDQLKGKAIDAGHAAQEKGIAMKAAHDKGFVQQEARADKENARY